MIKNKMLFIAAFSIFLSACGGGGGGGDNGGNNGGDTGQSNSAPLVTFTSPSSLMPGDSFSIPFTATDADGDSLTYKAQWVTPLSTPLSVGENVISGAIPSDITTNVTLGVLLSVSDGKATTNKTINIPVVVSSSSPTIQISSGLKTKVFGGYSFSVQYTVSDKDSPQNAIMVSALSSSDKLTVTVDKLNKKINVITSETDVESIATVNIVASDGVNTGESSFTVKILPKTPDFLSLESDISSLKSMILSGAIKGEDISFIDTLGIIALSKGTITPDDIEREKSAVLSEHSALESSALQVMSSFESNMADPDSITSVASDFLQWKNNLLGNYAPNSVAIINSLAQAASVSGLIDASVTKTFPYSESRFLGNPAYIITADGKQPRFKDSFLWMYATENGLGEYCVLG